MSGRDRKGGASTAPERTSQQPLDERQVAEYLRGHPEFFERHQELLTELRMPHPESGQAVSLVERQVGVLRDQKQELKQRLKGVARNARNNEHLLERIQGLILALVDCRDLDGAVTTLQRVLREEFHAEAVALRLFREGNGATPLRYYVSPDSEELQPFHGALSRREPVCGYLTPEQVQGLFPEQANEMVSGALIPLCEEDGHCLGLLGVGSGDPKRFHPEMGTVFLRHLGTVVAAILRQRLDG